MRIHNPFWIIVTNICTACFCYLFLFHYKTGSEGEGFPKCPQAPISLNQRAAPVQNVELPIVIIRNCTPATPKPDSINLNSDIATGRTIANPSGLVSSRNPISCLDGSTVSPSYLSNHSLDANDLKTILAITPTYKRPTQKLDLLSLCHTIMHVPNFLWIVIEDAAEKTDLVSRLLERCKVNSVHLNAPTSKMTKRARQRGVEQRNTGLDWIRKYCKDHCGSRCNAVVYFMDDDNKYDLRLFHEMRKTRSVSVFPVAFSGGLEFEGPICENEKATAWQAVWQSKQRHIPVDMAAFAIHVRLFIEKPEVKVGYRPGQRRRSKSGFMESDLIKSIGSSRERIECRGIPNEVLVWHVKTTKPFISYKTKYPNVEI